MSGTRYTSLYFMKESQKQQFVSLEPSTECFRENPRRLDMMIMSGKSQMFDVIAQHVFHDDEEGLTG